MKEKIKKIIKILTIIFITTLVPVQAQNELVDENNFYDDRENLTISSKPKSLDDLTRSESDYLEALMQLRLEKISLSHNNKYDIKRIDKIDDEIKIIEQQLEDLRNIEEDRNNQKLSKYLGTPIFDKDDFWKLVIKGLFNFIIILLIVRYIYYPVTKNKDYLFTYFLISLTVFLLCFLLDNVKLELGFALGLFAIFGIIRYRTDPIPIKEMTYLFIVIGISVINALSNKKISHAELIFANFMIVFITYGMEKLWLLRHESRKNITYERIELIQPDRRQDLLADLKKRTGIDVIRVEVRRIDFLRDTANLRIFYYEKDKD